MEIARGDLVLCRFFFSDLLTSKNRPVVVFKSNLKKYGTLDNAMFKKCQESFCDYFDC